MVLAFWLQFALKPGSFTEKLVKKEWGKWTNQTVKLQLQPGEFFVCQKQQILPHEFHNTGTTQWQCTADLRTQTIGCSTTVASLLYIFVVQFAKTVLNRRCLSHLDCHSPKLVSIREVKTRHNLTLIVQMVDPRTSWSIQDCPAMCRMVSIKSWHWNPANKTSTLNTCGTVKDQNK